MRGRTLVAGNGVTVSNTVGEGDPTIALVTTPLPLTGGQIAFPATQNPSANVNTLDDYEEGTFTPVISFGGASVGITYSTQSGVYTKIGNLVVLNVFMVMTSKGSSTGNAVFSGMPFSAGLPAFACMCGYYAGMSGLTGAVSLVSQSGTAMSINQTGAVTVNPLADTNFSNTSAIAFDFSYQV